MTDPIQNDGQTSPRANGILLQAKELTFRTRAGVNLLSDISFHIEPGEVVALTGLSRAGTAILLQCLAGLLAPSKGEVLIDGISLYANEKAFRATIGYVPPDLALYPVLTVAQTLQDAARLRLPRRFSSQERKQRVQTVLETTGLTQMAERQISSLSEVDKRKVSIAVELIGYPQLLLLDQSSEPLTPFDEVQITILMRELARQGITIIHVNPRSRSGGLADKVIFLAPGGHLAWFGPADEAFSYLKGLLPRGVVKDLFGLQEAIEMLVNPQERDGIEWAKRFTADPAYQKYVDDPLNNRYPDLMLQTHPLLRIRLRSSSNEKLPPPIVPRANLFQKLLLLIGRNSRLLWLERTGFQMLAIPPLIALIHVLLSSVSQAASPASPVTLNLQAFLVILTSAFLVQNEIYKERTVYQRENRTGTLLYPYVLSKIWLVGLLAIYQGVIWAIANFLTGAGSTAGLPELLPQVITLSLIAFLGGILGLIVSALTRTARINAVAWVVLLVVPQLLFLVSPLNPWPQIVIISLLLIFLLVGIQHRTPRVGT